MTLEPNTFTLELSNKLNAAGNDYTIKTIDLDAYGTSCKITKHDSDRQLHITPIEGDLIDLALFDRTGATIATGTLFLEIATEITSENLAKLVSLCF